MPDKQIDFYYKEKRSTIKSRHINAIMVIYVRG